MSKKNKFRKPAIVCPFCATNPETSTEEPGRILFVKRYFGEKKYPVVRDGVAIRPDKSTLVKEDNNTHFLLECTKCKFKTFCEEEKDAYEAMDDLARWTSEIMGNRGTPESPKEIKQPQVIKPSKSKFTLCLIRKERKDGDAVPQ